MNDQMRRALERFEKTVGDADETNLSDKAVEAVERFCGDLQVSILRVVEKRLSRSLDDSATHKEDCRIGSHMSMTCSCGGEVEFMRWRSRSLPAAIATDLNVLI